MRARTCVLTCAPRHIHWHPPRCVYCAARIERASSSRIRGCIIVTLRSCSSRRHLRPQKNRGPGLSVEARTLTRSLSLSFLFFFLRLSFSLLRSERAFGSSSKARRVVDHRYGGREARKWPTIGRRILFAGKRSGQAFRASRVSQGDSPRKVFSRPFEISVDRDGEVSREHTRCGTATFDRDHSKQ